MQQLFAISQPGGFDIRKEQKSTSTGLLVLSSLFGCSLSRNTNRWRILFMFLFLFGCVFVWPRRIRQDIYLCTVSVNVCVCDGYLSASRIGRIAFCSCVIHTFWRRNEKMKKKNCADRESNLGTTVLHGAPLILFTSNWIHQIIMINVNHRSRTPTW